MTYGSFSTDLLLHPDACGFVFPIESLGVGGELSLLPAAASDHDLCNDVVSRPVMLPHRMLRHHFAIGNQRGRHQALFYLLKHSRSKPREKTNHCQQADPDARKMQTTSRGEGRIDVPADRLHQELQLLLMPKFPPQIWSLRWITALQKGKLHAREVVDSRSDLPIAALLVSCAT